MISVDASTLHEALKIVKPAVSARGHLPVLTGVKLHAHGSVLDVTATDLDLTIDTSLPCSKGDLDVIVPAAQFTDFVSRAKDALSLETKDDDLIAESGSARLELRTLASKDWPQLPAVIGEGVMLTADSVALIGCILHAASADKSQKRAYRGVQLRGTQAIATDSYRMGVAELGIDLPDLLLPASAVQVIVNECDGPIDLCADKMRARVTNLATSWTFRLFDDRFPEINPVLRDDSPAAIEVNRLALKDALAVSSIAGETKLVRLCPQGEELLVASQGVDIGRSEWRLTLEHPSTFEGEVGFNGAYLRDALDVLSTDTVSLGLVDRLKPAIVREGPLTLLVMPKAIS